MDQETYDELHAKRSKYIENIDYQLIPLEEHPDSWGVRFLNGPFVETVIIYYAIAVDEVKDHLSFNFDIIKTPDGDLTEERKDLQQYAADVLQSIIINGLSDGSVELGQ